MEILSKEWLDLNARLQSKKNAIRKQLATKGILEKDKKNEFDKYAYFSEAGYKKLFTELFSNAKVELTTNVEAVEDIVGTDKQQFARRVTMSFKLSDIETGFYEVSEYIGEAMDKGDKAIYKAYTGGLKYFFANTFNVATGDDPEMGSPDGKKEYAPKGKQRPDVPKDTDEDAKIEQELVKQSNIDALKMKMEKKGIKSLQICEQYKIQTVSELTLGQWQDAMRRLDATADKKPVDLGL